jgi:TfoX/Sxy family transcriptional regulator of competence genes
MSLFTTLLQAAAGFPDVTQRRMFGCAVWLVRGKMFALIHDDRVVLKISAVEPHNALMAIAGAETWSPGAPMLNWIVLPTALAHNAAEFQRWVHIAHANVLAEARHPQPQKKARKRSTP